MATNWAVEELADRIRALMAGNPAIAEKRMFGGIAFMLNGNMLVGPTKSGGLLVRVGKEAYAEALELPGAGPMMFTGKEMPGFIDVSGDALEDDEALADWIGRARAFVSTLPAK